MSTLAWHRTPLQVGLLSMASVPVLHLYLRVELSPLEQVLHALDVGLAAALACTLARGGYAALRRWGALPTRGALQWVGLGVSAAVSLLLFLGIQGVLPGASAIRDQHEAAGYGDMALRVVPLAGLIAYLAWASEWRASLRRQLAELRDAQARLADAPHPPLDADRPLALVHDGGTLLARTADVLRVQAMENYCEWVLRSARAGEPVRRVLVRMTLGDARQKLPADGFVQPHRSHLVRLDAVRAVVRDGRSLGLDLGDAGTVPVSRAQRTDLLARLQGSARA